MKKLMFSLLAFSFISGAVLAAAPAQAAKPVVQPAARAPEPARPVNKDIEKQLQKIDQDIKAKQAQIDRLQETIDKKLAQSLADAEIKVAAMDKKVAGLAERADKTRSKVDNMGRNYIIAVIAVVIVCAFIIELMDRLFRGLEVLWQRVRLRFRKKKVE